MNIFRYLKKKGVEAETLGIILLVIGLALFIILYLALSSQGKANVGNLSELRPKWPWEV